ncbi:chromate transporter [Mycoplasma sp. OR1901]|uniref:chromate transporter n=1 Tax=Mycoplasma sp. OR1901 TaxID=2742195 RepID=UPI003530149C
MIALLVSIPLLILVSLIVFGGGQVFMPIFSWMWNLLNSAFGSNINDDTINKIFTVSNTTPGVVSTKFAFFTGYLVANGEWWGYLAIFLTYLVFCLPAIIMVLLAMKYISKFRTNTFTKNLMTIMKPIVSGIIISLAIQLFIGVFAPEITFNKGVDKYAMLNSKNIFIGYKNILLKIFVPVGILYSYWLAKKNYSLFWIIIINVSISFIIFGIPTLLGK